MTEKSTEVAPGSTGNASEDDLLGHSDPDGNGGEVLLDGSNATMIPENHSDDDREFDPELPTKMESSDQITPAKDEIVEKENAATNDEKSEKKLPTTRRQKVMRA